MTLGFQYGYDASALRWKYSSGFSLTSPQVANFLGADRILPYDIVSKQRTRSETSFPTIFMP